MVSIPINSSMDLFFILVLLNTILSGIIAGVSFDVAFVKLPTRKRIGAIAYAQFARGNDLGNGKIVYPILGIGSIVLVLSLNVVAFLQKQPTPVLFPVVLTIILTILHSLCTGKAAPIMISLKNTPDEEKVLKKKLDAFTYWHALRTIFQLLTFFAVIWSLVALLTTK